MVIENEKEVIGLREGDFIQRGKEGMILFCGMWFVWMRNEWEMKNGMNNGGDSLNLFVLRLNWGRKDNGLFSHLVIHRKREMKGIDWSKFVWINNASEDTSTIVTHSSSPGIKKDLRSCVFARSEQKKSIVQSRIKHGLAYLIKWRSWMWFFS